MNMGKIVQVIGNVVDVEFAEGKLPEILTAIAISNPSISDQEGNLIVEVGPGHGWGRCMLSRRSRRVEGGHGWAANRL